MADEYGYKGVKFRTNPTSPFSASTAELRRNLASNPALQTAVEAPGATFRFLQRGANFLTYPFREAPREALRIARSGVLTQPLFATPGMEASGREMQRTMTEVGAPPMGTFPVGEGAQPAVTVEPERIAKAGQGIASRVAGTAGPQTGMRSLTSTPVEPGFEEFAAANQGASPEGEMTLEGPRIIRRPGQTPILTNLTGQPLETALAEGGQFTRNNMTGQGITLSRETGDIEGRFGVRPMAAEAAPVAETFTSPLDRLQGRTISIGDRPRSGGRGWLARATSAATNAALGRAAAGAGIRRREAAQAQQEMGLEERRVAATEANALAALQRAETEAQRAGVEKLGRFDLQPPKLDPLSVDPENPQFLPGSVQVGDTTIPLDQGDYDAVKTEQQRIFSRLLNEASDTANTDELLKRAGDMAVERVIRAKGVSF